MCHDMLVDVRGQLAGIPSFLPPSEFQGSNSSVRLGSKPVILPTKSSYQPPCVVFKCNLWNELFVNYMYVLSGYCTL